MIEIVESQPPIKLAARYVSEFAEEMVEPPDLAPFRVETDISWQGTAHARDGKAFSNAANRIKYW